MRRAPLVVRQRQRNREAPEELEPALDVVHHGERRIAGMRHAGNTVVLGIEDRPVGPGAAVWILEHDAARLLERVVPARERGTRRPAQLRIAVLHDAEGVFVEPEPEVQPVLLDTPVSAAPARALAAEAPADLVHGDALEALPPAGTGQLERRGHGGAAAAQDHQLLAPARPGHAGPRSLSEKRS